MNENRATEAGEESRSALDGLLAIYGQLTAALPARNFCDDLQADSVIGSCRLVEQIAEGGMGVVWRAEQTVPVQRTVALKMMKAGMDSSTFLRRFRMELEALSRLEHPNIARIYDAGMTPRGRPFLVMELVRGAAPVTEFCRKERTPLRVRLELFAVICEAVHHAHSRGIIHRDLKPSNLLLSAESGTLRPVVIDFGVARALDAEPGATLATETGRVVGTPAYMSPEQATGGAAAADARADVYSLGCVLYELLADEPPFDHGRIRTSSLAELVRILREEEPPPPSLRLRRAGKSAAGVRGEPDCIVMKALAKEPGRRYASAAALAEDVRQFLCGRPVSARPASPGYRLRKFLARHRTAATVMAAAAASPGLFVLFFPRTKDVPPAEDSAALARSHEEQGDEEGALRMMIAAAHSRLADGRRREAMEAFMEAARLSRHQAMPEAADKYATEAWRLSRTLALPAAGPWLPLSSPRQSIVNRHWYARLEVPMTWTDAAAACRELGGHLATISNNDENYFVHGWFAQTSVCWLGASRSSEGVWEWVTGEPFQFTKWAGGEPSDVPGGEERYLNFGSSRLTFFRKGDTWNDHRDSGDNSGWWLTYPVCEWEPPAIPPALPGWAARAASLPRTDAVPFGGHWYARINVEMSWTEAEAVCVALGGHLAAITSAEENDFVCDRFATDRYVWLGGTDEGHEGQWRWTTGESWAFTAWGEHEPSNIMEAEHFLSTGRDTWNEARAFPRLWNDMPVNGDWASRMITSPVCEWDHPPGPR